MSELRRILWSEPNTPSGGQVDETNGNDSGTVPYAFYAPYYGTVGAGETEDAHGLITSTWTWMPDGGDPVADPPPTCVLVHQYCQVYAEAESFSLAPGSVSASNGLPGATTTGGTINMDEEDNPDLISTSNSVGDYYYLDGGAVITITCDPSGNSTASDDPATMRSM